MWWLKPVCRVVLVFLGMPALYVLIAGLLSVIPARTPHALQSPFNLIRQDGIGQENIEIFIWSNGAHTDFVLPIQTPQKDWRDHFPFQHFRRIPARVTHLGIGWGDRQFYMETPTWKDLRWTTAFGALFLQRPSALHVTYLQNPLANPARKRLWLSRTQYQKLVEYILESLQQDPRGVGVWIPNAGYSHQDAFYEAIGSFSFVRTCNEWTGEGLRRISVKTGYWTPFVFGVFYHLGEEVEGE